MITRLLTLAICLTPAFVQSQTLPVPESAIQASSSVIDVQTAATPNEWGDRDLSPVNALPVTQISMQETQVRSGRVTAGVAATVSMIPFKDAREIAQFLNEAPPNYTEIKRFLFTYFKLTNADNVALKATINDNAFLKQALGDAAINEIVNSNAVSRGPGDRLRLFASDAGQKTLLNPTVIADVLGTFIANRFKEEINAAFIQRFRKLLATNSDSLKLLFPESHSILLHADPYNYTSFLQSLQEAFEQDLALLPKNTVNYLAYNRHLNSTLLRSPVLFDVTLASLHLVGELQDGRPGLAMLSQLGQSRAVLSMGEPAVQHSMQLLSLLARNSTTDAAGEKPLTTDELEALATDQRLLNLFLGLITAKEKPLLDAISVRVNNTPTPLYAFINQRLASNTGTFYGVISSVVTGSGTFRLAGERIQAEQRAAQAENRKPNLAPHYLDMLGTGITILENSFNFYTSIATDLSQTPVALKDAFAISRQCIPIVRHVWEKRYGLALSHSVTLLQALFKTVPNTDLSRKQKRLERQTSRLEAKVNASFTGLPSTVLAEALAAAKATVGTAGINNDLRKSIGDGEVTGAVGNLMKYGSFMVTVVNAKTKEEMLLALESAALPVGSYRIKRNNYFTVSINSFGGIYSGYQNLAGNFQPLLAPSAPVGFYAGFGKSQVKVLNKDRQANGLFVSLIDVGSVFAFRLNDANTADLPELTWQNLLAPGAYYVHGFSNVLSLGIGAQYGPQLRAVKEGSAVFDPQAWRFGIKLTADIPIFNLHTKANRKRL